MVLMSYKVAHPPIGISYGAPSPWIWPHCMEGHSPWVQSITIGASWYIERFAKVGLGMDSCAKKVRKNYMVPTHLAKWWRACWYAWSIGFVLSTWFCHLVEHLALLPTVLKGNCWLMAFGSCYFVQSLVLDTTYKFKSVFIDTSLSFSPKPYLGLWVALWGACSFTIGKYHLIQTTTTTTTTEKS